MSKKEQIDVDLFGNTRQPDISLKSKKNEILDAYHELLNKVNETKQVSHQEVKKKQDEVALVAHVSEFSVDRIIANIADVKKSMGQGIEQLEQKLTEEYRRFSDLREAVKLEVAELDELHQIKKNVDTLQALLLAQKEYKANFELTMQQKKNEFEQEMVDAQAAWKKIQEEHEAEVKERAAQLKKERIREAEEYSYTTMLERKKDQDAYDQKQAALEKALAEKKARVEQDLMEREKKMAAQELEFKTVCDRVEKFPQEIEKAAKDAERITREELERAYKYQIDIATREVDGERKLNAQTITSLQTKIKEQEAFIRSLTQKTDEATNQVQAIALKALESSSYMRYHPAQDDAGSKMGQSSK